MSEPVRSSGGGRDTSGGQGLRRWRFTLSRRWLGYLALVVIFAIACVFLSMWQISRREEARLEIERVAVNWERTPRPVDQVLPTLTGFSNDDKWTPVTLTGRYLTEEQLLARGRPFDGNAGFEQLVPFLTDDGRVFIVDRGWLPVGNSQDEPDQVPPAPSGVATVVVRLKPGEPTIPGRSAPEGQVATINLPQIATLVDRPMFTGAYGLLASENPEVARPRATPKPVPDEGPHLSYAFQWLVFGLMAFIGLGWAVRQEYRLRNADDPEERERAAVRRAKAAAKPRSDSEVEDELLDAR